MLKLKGFYVDGHARTVGFSCRANTLLITHADQLNLDDTSADRERIKQEMFTAHTQLGSVKVAAGRCPMTRLRRERASLQSRITLLDGVLADALGLQSTSLRLHQRQGFRNGP